MNNIDIIDIPLSETEFAVLDFETTGTSARSDRVIEIGLVKIKNLKITDTYQSFINPGKKIPPFITNLTGINDSDVEGAPFFSDIVEQISDFIGDAVLTAHNMPFDDSFLKSELEYAGYDDLYNSRLCTLKLARKLYPELKSKSLSSLVQHFHIRNKSAHRAIGDATVTARILIKMIENARENHNIERISELLNFQSRMMLSPGYTFIKKKLLDDYTTLPDNPGVYFFKNRKEEIIYIGKAKSLKQRVKNYFIGGSSKKAKQIVRKASRLGYIETNSELTALLAEAELIKLHLPEQNVMLKKYSRAHFIKVNLAHKFPDISSTPNFDFDGCDYFGPYPNTDTAKLLIDIVDRTYQLRECSEKDFAKNKKCYLHDIKRCLAPCEYAQAGNLYNEELNHVYDFIRGKNQDAIDRLLKKMKEYSEQKKYEEAAMVRDSINSLLNQLNKTSIIAEPLNSTKLLVEVLENNRKDHLLFLEGKVFIKNFPLNEKENFEEALNDYFSGTINIFRQLDNKDLEQMKISLSWLVKNRNRVKLYYLSDYTTKHELFLSASQGIRKNLITNKEQYRLS